MNLPETKKMIEFNCPHCGHEIKIGEQFSGRRGKCNGCGKQIVVPDTGSEKLAGSVAVKHDGKVAGADTQVSYDDLVTDIVGPPEPLAPERRNSTASIESDHQVAPSLPPPPPTSAVQSTSNLWPCPDCAQFVSLRASWCPHCGCQISEPEPLSITPPLTELTAIRSFGDHLLLAIGTLSMVYFAFGYDTTTDVGDGVRVHNQGLLNDRIVGVLFSGMLVIRGAIPTSLVFGKPKTSELNVKVVEVIADRAALLVIAAAIVVTAVVLIVVFSTL